MYAEEEVERIDKIIFLQVINSEKTDDFTLIIRKDSGIKVRD